jgi:hypothetical protein
MLGLAAPGSRVWLSRSDNPARKLCYSWELIEVAMGGDDVAKAKLHIGEEALVGPDQSAGDEG